MFLLIISALCLIPRLVKNFSCDVKFTFNSLTVDNSDIPFEFTDLATQFRVQKDSTTQWPPGNTYFDSSNDTTGSSVDNDNNTDEGIINMNQSNGNNNKKNGNTPE